MTTIEKHKMYINGEWKNNGNYYTLYAPYDQEAIAEIPLCTKSEVLEAVESAKQSTEVMKSLTRLEISNILHRVANIFEERLNECAEILTLENSKPIKAAKTEIQRTIETYRFAADEAKSVSGETIPVDAALSGKGKIAMTVKEPLGVIGAITPFNFPFNLVAHKLGPAFAMKNTVVLKPASQTPLSAIMTVRIFEEAGLPKGALNLVFGRGGDIGDILTTHPDINMLTFTGSVEVGKSIKERAGLKRVTLELGSNAAVIVDSVDVMDEVVSRCVEGAYGYSGQACISVQRIYVQEALVDEFTKKMKDQVKLLKIGSPKEEETIVSSLINENEAKRIESWIHENKQENILVGGKRQGSIIEPTILTNVASEKSVSCKEVFGPVVLINSYSTFEEAIKLVNDSKYGLQAGVYTQSVNRAFEAIDKIQVGGVIINDIPSFRVDQMPYGGVKESGTGREGVKFSMEEMCELKLAVLNIK